MMHACPYCEKEIFEDIMDLEYSYEGYERYDDHIVENYYFNCPHCGKLVNWEDNFYYSCTELHKGE